MAFLSFARRISHTLHFKKFPSNLCKRNATNWAKVKMDQQHFRIRPDPVIMKLDTIEFHSIFTPELKVLVDLFKKHGHEIKLVGGAVRDIVMGIKPKDLDFATNATPTEMKDMFTIENVRMINSNGEKHGTITPRINDKENFEVTTLRIDVLTDGRRAKVEFTKDWKLDANRRDLTINAMYIDFEGNLYDYFYGYDDLKNRRIVFVGDPNVRIQEDFLRILRYFRFYGRISEDAVVHDSTTIAAIKSNVDGLAMVSGERIWIEWKKILEGNYSGELTLKMIECGMTEYIGLPQKLNIEHFKEVYYRAMEKKITLNPITLICAMLQTSEDVMKLHERLKLSAFERDLGFFVVMHREYKPSAKPLKPYQQLVLHAKTRGIIRNYVIEVLKYRGAIELLTEFELWSIPTFPINGHMLQTHVSNPKMIGKVIYELKEIWFNKGFKIDTGELMVCVPNIVSNMEDKMK